MPLLPTKNYSDQANAALLSKVKKGNKEAQSEFVWQNQSQFYAIAFMATNNKQASLQLCIDAFKQSLAALEQFQHQQLVHLDWDWFSQFIVNACAQFHAQYSHVPNTPITDPSADGSAQLDFGKNTVLDTQKIKMCLSLIPEEHKKVFILRHQLGLAYNQIATVLNQNPDNILAWLFRARVQLIKCLGHG